MCTPYWVAVYHGELNSPELAEGTRVCEYLLSMVARAGVSRCTVELSGAVARPVLSSILFRSNMLSAFAEALSTNI